MTTGHERECCTFCGLPLARPWWSRHTEQHAFQEKQPVARYCCYGCALAQAATNSGTSGCEMRALLTRLGLAIFLTMNVMVFSMELWTQDVYAGDPGATSALSEPLRDVFRYLCLLLSLPVAWMLGRPIAENAWENLRRGGPSTELLIVLGVFAALVYSSISVFRGSGHIYFEVACVVLVMVTLGRWLDATGKLQTTAALDALAKLLPNEVRQVTDAGEVLVRPDDVHVGDRLRVLAGERFAFDGELLAGHADIDEQIISGESRPLAKGPGETVHAGSVNLDGDLLVRVTAELRNGTLQRMIDLVREARTSKGYHQRLADRVSVWFLPVIALVALVAFTIHARQSGFEQGMLAALAVSLIACPCALGLATPMAVWAALGRASQAQVLVRNGEALERLAQVRAIAIDKTGTLTTGVATVADFVTADDALARDAVLALVAAVADGSQHPLSVAIADFARQEGVDISAERLRGRTLAGRGIAADLPGGPSAYLGNLRLMKDADLSLNHAIDQAIQQACQQAQSFACAGWEGKVRAVFLFQEELRADAQQALASCRELGLHVCVLTGDHAARAATLAEYFQVEVRAELNPAEKVAALHDLRRQWGAVAMVGDGINDAPALVASNVGIAMGCGADVSRQSASICLLGNQLERIPWSVDLARQTVRVIRQNLFWAFFYNIGGVALACAGWLNPIWAAVAMVASSVLVVGNSLRLRGLVNERMPEWGEGIQRADSAADYGSEHAGHQDDSSLETAAWQSSDAVDRQEIVA